MGVTHTQGTSTLRASKAGKAQALGMPRGGVAPKPESPGAPDAYERTPGTLVLPVRAADGQQAVHAVCAPSTSCAVRIIVAASGNEKHDYVMMDHTTHTQHSEGNDLGFLNDL